MAGGGGDCFLKASSPAVHLYEVFLQCQDCTVTQALRLLLWALEDVCSVLLGVTASWAICHGPLFVVYHSTPYSAETCSKLSSPTLCTYCLAFYDFFYHYPVDLLDVDVPEPFF